MQCNRAEALELAGALQEELAACSEVERTKQTRRGERDICP